MFQSNTFRDENRLHLQTPAVKKLMQQSTSHFGKENVATPNSISP
jgi:hypothetical protein